MGSRSEGKRSLWRETVWILGFLAQAIRGVVRMSGIGEAWKLAVLHMPEPPRKRRPQRTGIPHY